eukprot:NODE_929_length_3035_cov_0.464918.p1 type:complete len:461 gc:universal NODE_929_length_3035_cov_0.464918:1961-579(-)
MLDGFLIIHQNGQCLYEYIPFDPTSIHNYVNDYLNCLYDEYKYENNDYQIFHFFYDPYVLIICHHKSHEFENKEDLFQFAVQEFPSDNFDTSLKSFLIKLSEVPEPKVNKKKPKGKKKTLETVSTKDELDFSKDEKAVYDKVEVIPMRTQLLENTQLSIGKWFSKFSGSQRITESDLQKLLQDLNSLFVKKNIAQEIANDLCRHLEQKLVNQQVGRFESVWQVIIKETTTYLQKILQPKQNTNILELMQPGKPFIMAFVGVNGVGKTTNLSKICYWLLMNKKSILIAACDTFRSGAVEQLNIHVQRLGNTFDTKIELYQQGYSKDAATVAKNAIEYAQNNFDIVLIDTAGRMQDDEPLMRSLAKLVKINPIDSIVFVGEALVGNESIQQLNKFNGILQQRANRQIDFILLTKFDTVDDLVGAAINLVYLSKRPILFVGIGQNYPDLCDLDVASVVKTILK